MDLDAKVSMSERSKELQGLAGERAVLIYHNAAYPKVLDCQHSGFLAHPGLGFQSFIHQLNAAARQVHSSPLSVLPCLNSAPRKGQAWHPEDRISATSPSALEDSSTAMRMQITERNKQWHFVDFGAMSEVFTRDEHLADRLHPQGWFLRIAIDIFLNLYNEFRW